jgi:hypothetical protein
MKLTSWMFAVSLSCFTLAAVAAEGIDPSQGIADPCSKELWYDGKLLLLEGKGGQNTESCYDRLPATAKDKVRAPIWNLSHDSAGMCLRFLTEATSIRIRWTLRQENLALPLYNGVESVEIGVPRTIRTPLQQVADSMPSVLSMGSRRSNAPWPIISGRARRIRSGWGQVA